MAADGSVAGHSSYRRDIDGLRALAVLAVVGFHAGISGFNGGFVGVDVFFVISGFLIAGIIFRELDRGHFSFLNFYVRRVNRIFPALLLVLAATVFLGWMFMLPNELTALGRHVIGGATFSSNFILWKEYGYFDLPDKPLLHLWSLAVEEQFYLFFPLFAVLLARTRNSRRISLAILISASFMWNVWQVRHSQQNEAFFLPLGRAWEILAGALLADLELKGDRWYEKIRKRASPVAQAAGLILLVASVIAIDERKPWPGLLALMPILGTLLLISGREDTPVNKLLGSRILVAIGLISYPLYLWHWPLLVVGKMVNEGPLGISARVVLIATAFALATLTFQFIEKPVRFGRRKRRSAARLVPLLACMGLMGFAFKAEKLYGRLDSAEAVARRKSNPEPDLPRDGTIDGGRKILFAHLAGDSMRTVVLMGDSHMQQYWPRFVALRQLAYSGFPRIETVGYGGCPPAPGVNRIGVSWDKNPWDCPGVFAAQKQFAMRPEVTAVVLNGFWEDYLLRALLIPAGESNPKPFAINDPRLEVVWAGFESTVSDLVRAGKKVFVMLPSPVSRKYGEGITYHDQLPPRLRGLFGDETPDRGIPTSSVLVLTHDVRNRLQQIAGRTGATVIDPVQYLCDHATCPVIAPDGSAVFRDDNHLRPGFVRKYVTYLDVVVR